MPLVYLAGPDVFHPDATQRFARLARVCEALGLTALTPLDGVPDVGHLGGGRHAAQQIYAANMAMLRRADGVVANLRPFRGAEPDSGTVFEVGVAIALGLPVVGYGVPLGQYKDRVPSERDGAGVLRDVEGWAVEDFGLPLNLMLASSVQIGASAEEALKALAGQLLQRS